MLVTAENGFESCEAKSKTQPRNQSYQKNVIKCRFNFLKLSHGRRFLSNSSEVLSDAS